VKQQFTNEEQTMSDISNENEEKDQASTESCGFFEFLRYKPAEMTAQRLGGTFAFYLVSVIFRYCCYRRFIDIDREKIIAYNLWIGLLGCIPLVLIFGIGLILGAVVYAFESWYRPRWVKVLRYCLDEKSLRVEGGLMFKSRKTIPLDKITDLELVQGPLLRYFDMWIIKVQTASTGSQLPEATLIGVINPEQVREEILAARNEHVKSH
jgi:membrane protein YdbS with pleckstrin-like domain